MQGGGQHSPSEPGPSLGPGGAQLLPGGAWLLARKLLLSQRGQRRAGRDPGVTSAWGEAFGGTEGIQDLGLLSGGPLPGAVSAAGMAAGFSPREVLLWTRLPRAGSRQTEADSAPRGANSGLGPWEHACPPGTRTTCSPARGQPQPWLCRATLTSHTDSPLPRVTTRTTPSASELDHAKAKASYSSPRAL